MGAILGSVGVRTHPVPVTAYAAEVGAFLGIQSGSQLGLWDDLDVLWDGKELNVYPLMPTEEDPEAAAELLARSAAPALSAPPGIIVHERQRPFPILLHGLVLEELRSALDLAKPILGLGTWDPPEDLGLRKRAFRGPDGRMSTCT